MELRNEVLKQMSVMHEIYDSAILPLLIIACYFYLNIVLILIKRLLKEFKMAYVPLYAARIKVLGLDNMHILNHMEDTLLFC